MNNRVHCFKSAILYGLDFVVLLAVFFNQILDDGLIGLELKLNKVLAPNLDEVETTSLKCLVLLILLLVKLSLPLELDHEAFVVAEGGS